jgi:hypothetical protein
MRIPRLVQDLADFWGLSAVQTTHLWGAVHQSRWSTTVAWRQVMEAYEVAHASAQDVLGTPECAPAIILTLVESLVQEKRLWRASAVPIEERLLENVTRHGQWHGLPYAPVPPTRAAVEQTVGLNRLINYYWR